MANNNDLYISIDDDMPSITYSTNVFCTFTIEGIHSWKECDIDEVAYLKHPHRHLFFIKAKALVNHDNRDIEFIKMQHELRQYLLDEYYDTAIKMCDFKNNSCEHIAKELLSNFNYLFEVTVSEDNENGATVTTTRKI